MNEQKTYLEGLRAQINDWDEEILRLKQRKEHLPEDRREEHSQQIAQLQSTRDLLRNKVDEVSSASEESWHSLKEGVQNAWDSLNEGLENARKAFE